MLILKGNYKKSNEKAKYVNVKYRKREKGDALKAFPI